jgi:PAS domain S-box-containing protein
VVGASKIARDITDRKESERARFHLAAIVDSSDDAIASKDLNGIIKSWNHAAARMFGWSAEEIIGRSVLTIIPPHLQHEEPELLRKLRAGQRIEHYETQRIRKDGTIIDVSLTVSPIKDPTGKVIGASKIARDITDQKRMQRALIESEKLAATGRMAAAIAHEINNPLEAVTNLAYLLTLDHSLNDSAKNYANIMLQEISRASEITRQTLAFYRDSSRPTEVNLSELVENVLSLNRPKALKKNIVVRTQFRTHECVMGYAGEIRQVIANLVVNAIEAAPEGGTICARVSNAAGHEKEMLRISIADNGPGIAPENRGRLFMPFFTTKGISGNGLGLWVSKGIVEKHGGKIIARSRTDTDSSGTVFAVLLQKHQ